MLRTALLATAASASLMAAPTFAQAQQAAGEAVDVGEIVVTGSRIRRDTFSAPQPLSVVTAEAIRESGNTSIGDILLEQPNINPATNQQNSSGTLFLAGQTRADIRGLGPTRTLVLMDGRRLPFSDASSPAVDLNTIPSLMVERIETIAGGASAVYGSEAIAGVVNFIMKKEQDGLELDVQAGVSQEGDGEEFRTGFNWGGKFLDDRLNVLIGGEYAMQDKIMQKDREELFPGVRRNTLVTPQTLLPATRTNTSPFATFQIRGTNTLSSATVNGALAVTRDVRTNGSTLTRLSPECSTTTVQPTCQDESLFYSAVYNALQGKSDRAVLRGFATYDLTDTWSLFADATYVKAGGYGIFQPAFSSAQGGGTLPLSIRGDNAFLNGPGQLAADLRAVITGPTSVNGVLLPFAQRGANLPLTNSTVIQVARFYPEFGGRDVSTEREQIRAAVGFEGGFGVLGREVSVDGYAQFSELNGTTISYNVPNLSRVAQAVDAVLVNGQVACRDAAARAAGCVPFDVINGPSREAVLWTNAQSTTDQEVKQSVAGVNFATELFNLPAGPVGVAFGGEWRKEESLFVQDALGASGALFFNSIGTRGGEYDVSEAYGEIRIPILKDLPFAQELTVELAGRISDYSTIGKTDQYRLHAEWAPFEDIRFRASESTAVRAPNIVELYAPQSRNFTTAANDPCDKDVFAGATAAQKAARLVTCGAAIPGYNPATFVSNFGTGRPSLPLLQGGNPDLGPEEAKTYQYGVVITPRWVKNLQVSLDFFKYNITGQVGTIPINTLLGNLCYDSPQAYASNPFCAQIKRDPTGTGGGAVPGGVIEVLLVNQNVASVKVEGWDGSIAYGFNTEDVFGRDLGDLAFRLDATWMYRFALQGLPGQSYVQFANTITNATPEWKANASLRWSRDNYSVTWSTLWIDSMIISQTQQQGVLDPFMTGEYYRHDLRASYRVNDQVSVRAGIINLTNEFPPYVPEVFTGTGTGSSQYDNRGRFFFVGANFNF
ncbi:TonB-dependent receptor plug domain-containing protein [Phenylobacterium sp.]|jgi:outer membrane receptor protein involved in Fe transport|uniref:TonB-dependent receptor plug domain-containing protein n=1 Tax=Phenylobacterium sp. TaxID=1871053 RepID=UPI002F94494C